jgi:hypothetical protein
MALALLLLGLWPHRLHAQAFIASRPHPEFGIGPLFVSVSVGKDDVRPAHRPVTVTVTWNLVLPARGTATDIAQDLYLLWPGEVAGAAGAAEADRHLLAQVGALGFRSKESGRLRLTGVRRSDLGTVAEPRPLGAAPFVTFDNDGAVREATGATVIRIPWVPELGTPDWLVRLQIPARDVIVRRPVTWIEDLFWGRWYVVRLAFGDLESLALYPFYFGVRDRVVPVAADFSMLLIDFADARRLRVDVTTPDSALRRQGERGDDRATIALALGPSRGLLSQLLKVGFTYAPQRLPARPLLISAVLVVLGGTLRWLFTPAIALIARTLRARVLLGRAAVRRYHGTTPSPEALARMRPGETTDEDVRRLFGPGAEERVSLPARRIRTVVYRERRVIPHRGRSLGWVATVRQWDVEDHEVEITFEHGRVRDVQTRVRRVPHSPLLRRS